MLMKPGKQDFRKHLLLNAKKLSLVRCFEIERFVSTVCRFLSKSQFIGFIDQMKNKLQFNVDDLDKYTIEELRQQVDQAIGQVYRIL